MHAKIWHDLHQVCKFIRHIKREKKKIYIHIATLNGIQPTAKESGNYSTLNHCGNVSKRGSVRNSSFQRWSVARAALINDLSNTRPSFACTHSHASTFTLAAFGAVAKECASGIITILPWESFIQLTARLSGSALEENQHPLRSRFSYFCNSCFVSCVFIDCVSALNLLLQTVLYTWTRTRAANDISFLWTIAYNIGNFEFSPRIYNSPKQVSKYFEFQTLLLF